MAKRRMVITGGGTAFTLTSTEPRVILNETDQSANGRIWDIDVNGGVFAVRTRTDADGAGTTAWSATRSGTGVTAQAWNASTSYTFNTAPISAPGGIGLGTGSATSTVPFDAVVGNNGLVTMSLRNNNAGTGAAAMLSIVNATGVSNGISVRVNGTGFTTSGMEIQDAASLTSGASLAGGLAVGSLGNAPVYLGSNNLTRMTLAGDGTSFSPVTDNALSGGSATLRYANWFATQLTVQGANGQATNYKHATTTVPAASAATLTASNLIPAGSAVIGVTVRVTTTLDNSSGLTSFSIGDGTDADRWGTGIAITAGTTTTNANTTITTLPIYAAATNVVLTSAGGNFNVAGGVVRVTVHYIDLSAATS